MREFLQNNKSTKVRHPEKINNPINPIKKKPNWIRTRILDTQNYFKTKEIINKKKLYTVCQEASCPNISECWSKRHATFMVMGDTCTRACSFCNVKTGKPMHLDPLEPLKIAQATKELDLTHVVITSVDRDDLRDGGAEHFSKIILDKRDSLFKTHLFECDTNEINLYLATSRNLNTWKIKHLLEPNDFRNVSWNAPDINNKMKVTPIISDVVFFQQKYYSFAYGDDAKKKTHIGILTSNSLEGDYKIHSSPAISPNSKRNKCYFDHGW